MAKTSILSEIKRGISKLKSLSRIFFIYLKNRDKEILNRIEIYDSYCDLFKRYVSFSNM